MKGRLGVRILEKANEAGHCRKDIIVDGASEKMPGATLLNMGAGRDMLCSC